MVALNTAHIFDGALFIAENVHCEKPIHLLYISGGEENTLAFPRNLMIAEKNSSAKLLKAFFSRGNESSFINIVTEVVLEENSNVEWSKIQLENLIHSILVIRNVHNLQIQISIFIQLLLAERSSE